MALAAAQKALRLAPELALAQRALAAALASAGQNAEALAAYDPLLSSPEATYSDFTSAGYLAAVLGRGPRSREIFSLAEQKFPASSEVLRVEGWALIDLNAPAEALKAFTRYESILTSGVEPSWFALAGLASSRWLSGDKDGAVADYQRLIAHDARFADADFVAKLSWRENDKRLMAAILRETLKHHPNLKPKSNIAVPSGRPKP
jgi:tetratricopeptide (TPR) repeat protein